MIISILISEKRSTRFLEINNIRVLVSDFNKYKKASEGERENVSRCRKQLVTKAKVAGNILLLCFKYFNEKYQGIVTRHADTPKVEIFWQTFEKQTGTFSSALNSSF